METSFRLFWPFNETDEPIDVLLVWELGHVVEKYLQKEFWDVGSFMFLPVNRPDDQLGNKFFVLFEQLCRVIHDFIFSLLLVLWNFASFRMINTIFFDLEIGLHYNKLYYNNWKTEFWDPNEKKFTLIKGTKPCSDSDVKTSEIYINFFILQPWKRAIRCEQESIFFCFLCPEYLHPRHTPGSFAWIQLDLDYLEEIFFLAARIVGIISPPPKFSLPIQIYFSFCWTNISHW